MNAPPQDLLRSGVPHMPPGMLNSQHYIQQQQVHGQPPQAQPQMPLQGSNPTMGILGGGQSNNPPNQLYQLQLQQANMQTRQQIFMQSGSQGMNGQPRAPVNPMGQHQMPAMAFANNMGMSQQQLRRAPSQNPALNQATGHMGPMAPGMNGLTTMSMNPGQGLPMRQIQQPQIPLSNANMRMPQQTPQHPTQMQQQNHLSDMQMGLNRGPHMPVTNGMAPHAMRTPSGQPMLGSMNHPSSLNPSHSGGMQHPMSQGGFANPMTMPHQHQPGPMGPSPHPPNHAQAHTPTNLAPNVQPPNVNIPHGPGNRLPQTQEGSMFINPPFQSSTEMQPNVPQVPRLTASNQQFFPSSTSPMQNSEVQNVGAVQMNAAGSSSRAPLMTPAQVVSMNSSTENFNNQFTLPPSQPSAPARPPSHNAPRTPFSMAQQSAIPHHHSPRASDHINTPMAQMQRPQSQQGHQRQSPQQPGASRTPRVSQQSLPGMIPQRIPMPPNANPPGSSQQPPAQPPPQPAPGNPPQVPTRQPPTPAPAAPASSNAPRPGPSVSEGAPPPQTSQQPLTIPRPPHSWPLMMQGQATLRLLSLSGALQKLTPPNSHEEWSTLIQQYFTGKATMKITLWKDSQKQEAKPFEIGTPILPRFFLQTTQSGVKSMSLGLDGAKETMVTPPNTQPFVVKVETDTAYWTFRYGNGYTVVLKGPLSAFLTCVPLSAQNQQAQVNVPLVWMIDKLNFDALTHEKLVNPDFIGGTRMDNPATPPAQIHGDEPRTIIERATIPGEPVNAFGIPQATMRCLELAESVGQMGPLITFAKVHNLGPIDALSQFAKQLRDAQMQDFKQGGGNVKLSHPGSNNGPGPGPGPASGLGSAAPGAGGNRSSSMYDHGTNGVAATPPVTLLPNTPSSSTMQSQGPSPSTPQNPPQTIDGSKLGKAQAPTSSSQASGSTPSASASTPSATTPGGPNTTPSMPNSTINSLKRKAPSRTDPSSPTIANGDAAAAAKRTTRKRTRTQGG